VNNLSEMPFTRAVIPTRARALTVPKGGHLDGEQMNSPSFVRWLSRKTSGLVKMKTVRRLDEETFIDVRITEAMNGG